MAYGTSVVREQIGIAYRIDWGWWCACDWQQLRADNKWVSACAWTAMQCYLFD